MLETETLSDTKKELSGLTAKLFAQVQALVRWGKKVSSGMTIRENIKFSVIDQKLTDNVTVKIEAGFAPVIVQVTGRIDSYRAQVTGNTVMITARTRYYPVQSVFNDYLYLFDASALLPGDVISILKADGDSEECKILNKTGNGVQISRSMLTDIQGVRLVSASCTVTLI